MNRHFPLGDISPSRYFLSAAVAIGLIFTFISGDADIPIWRSLIQWQLQTCIPITLIVFFHLLLAKVSAFRELKGWQQVLISGLCGSLCFTPIALVIEITIADETLSEHWSVALVGEFLGMGPPVILCWFMLNVPWLYGGFYVKPDQPHHESKLVTKSAERSILSKPKFYRLLPHDIQGTLYSLKAELHYIKVLTDQGSDLILYALKDAINELPEEQGMQVHRSYWVSFCAIADFKKDGRQGTIILVNGDEVPVSRTFVGRVSELAMLNAKTVVKDLTNRGSS